MCYINHAIFCITTKNHIAYNKKMRYRHQPIAHIIYIYILLIHYHLATTIFAYRDIHLYGISRQKFFYQLWPLDEA